PLPWPDEGNPSNEERGHTERGNRFVAMDSRASRSHDRVVSEVWRRIRHGARRHPVTTVEEQSPRESRPLRVENELHGTVSGKLLHACEWGLPYANPERMGFQ